MKKILLLFVIFCALKANAQNYLISFTGTGSAVTSVKVENLTAGTSATLTSGSDILSLTLPTGENSVEYDQSPELKIYPNPMTEYSTLEFSPPFGGDAVITVSDMTGKPVAQINSHLDNLRQDFRISGLRNGFYFVNVKGNGYQYSGKLVSNGQSIGTINIAKVNSNIQAVEEKTNKSESKGTLATIDMPYTNGDRLKFTGVSTLGSTVIIDIPVSSKNINFNFFACTDGDNIKYSIVAIGTQVWMAENLKTTKYRNGVVIGTTTSLDITGETTPKYQWAYGGNETNVATYGRLYSYYAVTDARGVCPTGWHVPDDAEWSTLHDYLTNNGFGFTSGNDDIAKSMAASSGWTIDPTPGNAGNNQISNNKSGFSALPGGYRRSNDGTYLNLGINGYWRSTTLGSVPGSTAWYRAINSNDKILGRNDYGSWNGFSVRCLKD